MKTKRLPRILFSVAIILICSFARADEKNATVTIDSAARYQKITGFGGFVCSGQFAYNWMTASEIKKTYGISCLDN